MRYIKTCPMVLTEYNLVRLGKSRHVETLSFVLVSVKVLVKTQISYCPSLVQNVMETRVDEEASREISLERRN